jgi:hypothetical protein
MGELLVIGEDFLIRRPVIGETALLAVLFVLASLGMWTLDGCATTSTAPPTPPVTPTASATLTVTPILASKLALFVTNRKTEDVTAYPLRSSGNVKPIATITDGADTQLSTPVGIALDSTGQIYVANGENVTVYPAGTNHNVTPLFTITGPSTYSDGIALDSHKNIYLVGRQGGTNGNGIVNVFAPDSKGNARPSATITFDTKRLPTAVAVDSGGNVYIAGNYGGPGNKGSVGIYRPGSHGNAMPIATIDGTNTGINSPSSIELDSIGRIYVANPGAGKSENDSVNVYPPLQSLSSGPDYPNVRPLATISGGRTKLAYPQTVALDSTGRIYVLNVYQDLSLPSGYCSITVYPPLGSKTGILDETPLATIAGPDTKLDMVPMGIAVWDPPTPKP